MPTFVMPGLRQGAEPGYEFVAHHPAMPGAIIGRLRRPQNWCSSVSTVSPGGSTIADLSVEETWQRLSSKPASVLIDVRTKAEWAFVGLPDLSSIGKQPLLIEWQQFPTNSVDPDFADRLSGMLEQVGADKNSDLFFLCRSGGRSLMAARAMSGAGYTRCYNVSHGFEGGLDPTKHRGQMEGWKARKLPWVQG